MDKRKFRLAVVTPVVTALVVVTIIVFLILKGAVNNGPQPGVIYSPEMAEVADPEEARLADAGETISEADCDFDEWVGKEVDEEAVKAAGRVYRILGPNTPATMDFNPVRINVMVDDKRVVTAVRCG